MSRRSNLDYALQIAQLGLPVLPCHPQTKAALCQKGFKARSLDEATIRKWWSDFGHPAIGYVPADMNAIGLDMDQGDSNDGKRLLSITGEPCYKSTSSKEDRYHLLFHYEGPARNNGQWSLCGASGDVRHGNGYLVAWHPSILIESLERRDEWPEPVSLEVLDFLAGRYPRLMDASCLILDTTKGGRNTTLNTQAYAAAASGVPVDLIRRVLVPVAESTGLPASEVADVMARAIGDGDTARQQELSEASAVFGQTAATPAPGGKRQQPSDVQLGHEMAEAYASTLCWTPERGWMRWEEMPDGGAVWRSDPSKVLNEAVTICQRHNIGTKAKLANTADVAQRLMRRSLTDFDSDPTRINTPMGLVDLRTGETEPSSPHHLCTRIAKAAPDGTKPERFMQFLKEVMPEREIRDYLQTLAGYCLTGYAREHVLCFMWGTGRNGKSTFLNALQYAMGGGGDGYAMTSDSEIFSVQRYQAHREVIARLAGARLVKASEISQGATWNEVMIKSLTGGETIPARFMHKDTFELDPQFTLVITGNHRPRFRSVDPAMRSRLHMVPFTQFIEPGQRDRSLDDTLKTEIGGIMSWMIEGARRYMDEGLQAPESVKAASTGYLDSEDLVMQFIQAKCTRVKDMDLLRKELIDAFTDWYIAEGHGQFAPKGAQSELIARLQSEGYTYENNGRHMAFTDLMLNTGDPTDEDDPATRRFKRSRREDRHSDPSPSSNGSDDKGGKPKSGKRRKRAPYVT